ncbi:MAG: tetratricopeptide repeat protein [Kiritimatiellia bacterium]|jgi:TolA-binding protein|nr:tetratricopeptide repeat protein [Kiritimatiellia bacterium]
MRIGTEIRALMVCVLGVLLLSVLQTRAAREAKGTRDTESADYAASKVLKRGGELLELGERERGVKMLKTVIEQNPKSSIRFKAYLALGRHYLELRENANAVEQLRYLANLKQGDEELDGEELDMFLEGLYLTGVAYFNSRQFGAAFSALRKITGGYPNTVWANQAYYYIGMSHFAQEHWSKAINNLNLVGTFIDTESPEVEYMEAGHRFYVKIIDGDLPVLKYLGKHVEVVVKATSGDSEIVVCTPQVGRDDVFVGSVRTDVGKGAPGDHLLHLVGGDTIETTYRDDSTRMGEKNVPRVNRVKVTSSGALAFTRGTYGVAAVSAFVGQPFFLRLRDIDLDTTDGKDTIKVHVTSTYLQGEDEALPELTVDIEKILEEDGEGQKKVVRDEIALLLTEDGEHSGVFVGTSRLGTAENDKEVKKSDSILNCTVGDTIVAMYRDELTIRGEGLVEVRDELAVLGEMDARPRADQDVVFEATVRARKEIVEAEAYLEIARIFQSMGLKKGAGEKSDQGLDKVKFAIQTQTAIPTGLREKAFSIKWNLYLAQDDFSMAMATCRAFSHLYPESPLVDNALMGIGRIFLKKKEYEDAIEVFRQVVNMPNAHSSAEAQFLIAETTELMIEDGKKQDAAISAYKLCATRFPDSEFAGPSLAKIVDYHIQTGDYAEAEELLMEIFLDYQDEEFLDRMLLKWVLVAFDRGDFKKAHEKCRQLMFEYPGSVYASKAQEQLPKIEAKLGIEKPRDN